MRKLITVFGATGTQGGSVARALLKDGTFKVRGITRNVNSEKAKTLTEQGIEMVEASMEDPSSLKRALVGSYGVFALTDFWEVLDKDKEAQMGKNIVDAAKDAGVQHMVYTGLPSPLKLAGIPCPHLDGKAEVDEYMFQSGVTATSVHFPTYMEVTFRPHMLRKVEPGKFVLGFPMEGKPLHLIYAREAGTAIVAIFKDAEKFKGKVVSLSGDKKTVAEYCEILSEVLAPAHFTANQMTAEEFSHLGRPKTAELGAMFKFLQTEHVKYNQEETKRLDPETKDFRTFVTENKDVYLSLMN